MNVFKVFNCSNLVLRGFYNCKQSLPSISTLKNPPLEFRQFSSLLNASSALALNNFNSFTPLVMPSCGMKAKGCLELRCKDCYFERRDGEMYVFCNSYGRHKQKLRRTRNRKANWILSYAFMSKIRPY